MQNNYAPIKYVHSKITVYHSSKVDQKFRRAIHSCAICNLHGLREQGVDCGAVHYGICTAVVLPQTVLKTPHATVRIQAGPTPKPHFKTIKIRHADKPVVQNLVNRVTQDRPIFQDNLKPKVQERQVIKAQIVPKVPPIVNAHESTTNNVAYLPHAVKVKNRVILHHVNQNHRSGNKVQSPSPSPSPSPTPQPLKAKDTKIPVKAKVQTNVLLNQGNSNGTVDSPDAASTSSPIKQSSTKIQVGLNLILVIYMCLITC